MFNIFMKVKANVTARQAAELYGLQVGGNGMCRCPFHGDRTPSMKVDERYYCFGCHETGDVIDLTAKLFGLTPLQAARKLAADFGIDPDEPGAEAALAASVARQSEQARMRRAVLDCSGVLIDYEAALKRRQERYAPRREDEVFDERFVCRRRTSCRRSAT